MRKTLIVVDMQNDFITGALGSAEAVSIVENVKHKIAEYVERGDEIIFTRDTHKENYLDTHEGKYLPVVHCVYGTRGWEIPSDIDIPSCEHIDKNSFGYADWGFDNSTLMHREFDEIEIVGLCTDICVISNALILRSIFPNVDITVDASCCAGVSPRTHKEALDVMKCCHIRVVETACLDIF